jgi:hypothetical protein
MKMPAFNEANVEQVCNVMGDASTRLSSHEPSESKGVRKRNNDT